MSLPVYAISISVRGRMTGSTTKDKSEKYESDSSQYSINYNSS